MAVSRSIFRRKSVEDSLEESLDPERALKRTLTTWDLIVLGVAVAVARGYLRTAFTNLWLMLMHWRTRGLEPVPGLTLKDGASPRLAYAIPITIGVMCTLWRR